MTWPGSKQTEGNNKRSTRDLDDIQILLSLLFGGIIISFHITSDMRVILKYRMIFNWGKWYIMDKTATE